MILKQHGHFNMKTFQFGDLLYGLKDVRIENIRLLRAKDENLPFKGFTIDNYNKAVLFCLSPTTLEGKCEYNFDNKIDDWLQSEKFKQETLLNLELTKKHIEIITNSTIPKLRITNENPAKKDKSKNIEMETRKTRRTCKARLFDQTTQVHFILDKLALKNIFSTDPSNFKNKKGYEAFTSSEMRFVIKNYYTISNHIKFYESKDEITLENWINKQSDEDKAHFINWCKQKDEQYKGTGRNPIEFPYNNISIDQTRLTKLGKEEETINTTNESKTQPSQRKPSKTKRSLFNTVEDQEISQLKRQLNFDEDDDSVKKPRIG